MKLAQQIKKDSQKMELQNKCINIFKNQLMDEGIYNFDEKFIIHLFSSKTVSELKKWLKTNDALILIRSQK